MTPNPLLFLPAGTEGVMAGAVEGTWNRAAEGQCWG